MLNNKNLLSITIFVVAIIIAGAIIYSSQNINRGTLSASITEEEAGEIAIDFINNIMLQGQASASLISVSEEYGLYKIDINFQGNDFASYISKDGKTFFPEAMNIEEIKKLSNNPNNETAPPVIEEESNEEQNLLPSKEIGSFVSCLKDKNFVIYGASWCGYCKQVVDLFGGKEITSPIYIECTEEEELCKEKEITGYPTILIGDARYTGSRSLQGFADATGCKI